MAEETPAPEPSLAQPSPPAPEPPAATSAENAVPPAAIPADSPSDRKTETADAGIPNAAAMGADVTAETFGADAPISPAAASEAAVAAAAATAESADGSLQDLLDKANAGAGDQENAQPTIEELLRQATFEDAALVAGDATVPGAEPIQLPNFQQAITDAQVSSIDLLRDVELSVKIELGRSRMLVENVLKLGEGSVVELDKLAGDPVDVFVNERLVARGEVLVLNDNFCVRVNEIVAALREET